MKQPAERKTTLVRIGLDLLAKIRGVADKDRRTVRETMEQVLRERFMEKK